ncbi:MAG: RnfABCDGE type electron transport complex subunit D [Treponema sp.]|nr:RnfABCDGE type electron transport complex subunit D [Treponema sp.]
MKTNLLIRKKYAIVRPFIYKKSSLTSISIRILVLLLIQIVCLGLYKSYDALIVIGSCTAASTAVFLLRYFTKAEPVYNVFDYLLQGIFTGMLLPESFPPVVAALITLLVILGIKYIISNSTNVWVNSVCFSVLLAWFIGKSFFPEFMITTEMFENKNPSLTLIQSGAFSISSVDSIITTFLNNYVFKFLKVSVPEGYISFLWDSHSVIPAFRFNFLTVFSSIILFSDESIGYLIPGIFLFVYSLLVRLFAPMFFGGLFNSGDIILALFSSGTLFVALFMLQWFGTTPGTQTGKILYAVICGIIAFLLVGAGTSPVGMVYTIIMGNILSVVIKVIETRTEINSVKKVGVSE